MQETIDTTSENVKDDVATENSGEVIDRMMSQTNQQINSTQEVEAEIVD